MKNIIFLLICLLSCAYSQQLVFSGQLGIGITRLRESKQSQMNPFLDPRLAQGTCMTGMIGVKFNPKSILYTSIGRCRVAQSVSFYDSGRITRIRSHYNSGIGIIHFLMINKKVSIFANGELNIAPVTIGTSLALNMPGSSLIDPDTIPSKWNAYSMKVGGGISWEPSAGTSFALTLFHQQGLNTYEVQPYHATLPGVGTFQYGIRNRMTSSGVTLSLLHALRPAHSAFTVSPNDCRRLDGKVDRSIRNPPNRFQIGIRYGLGLFKVVRINNPESGLAPGMGLQETWQASFAVRLKRRIYLEVAAESEIWLPTMHTVLEIVPGYLATLQMTGFPEEASTVLSLLKGAVPLGNRWTIGPVAGVGLRHIRYFDQGARWTGVGSSSARLVSDSQSLINVNTLFIRTGAEVTFGLSTHHQLTACIFRQMGLAPNVRYPIRYYQGNNLISEATFDQYNRSASLMLGYAFCFN